MIDKIPETFRDLLRDETKAFACLATLMRDGAPQNTIVWFNTDGEYILVNTFMGRTKQLNMAARRDVAMVIMDPKNPYRYIQVRGHVADEITEGAVEHINVLARKYTGGDYKVKPGEKRIMFRINPDFVSTFNG